MAEQDERQTPLWRHVALLVGFLLVVLAGVLTVLVPELTDEGPEEPDRAAPPETGTDEDDSSPTE